MLKRQDEARLWRSISLYGFWLRDPRELSSHFPRVSPGLLAARDEFLRYGFELEILEHDLTECVNEFATACEPPPPATLFKINLDADHGGGSGRYDYLREIAFDYAWVLAVRVLKCPGGYASDGS